MKGIVVTGGIGEGKTTAMLDFIGQNPSVGILTLKIKGKRYFLNVKSGEKFLAEADPSQGRAVLKAGQFLFNPAAFEKARKIVLTDSRIPERPIIIDEYGHLELKGKGFEPLLEKIVKTIRNEERLLIITVRESLVKDFTKKFNFVEWQVIKFTEKINLTGRKD